MCVCDIANIFKVMTISNQTVYRDKQETEREMYYV